MFDWLDMLLCCGICLLVVCPSAREDFDHLYSALQRKGKFPNQLTKETGKVHVESSKLVATQSWARGMNDPAKWCNEYIIPMTNTELVTVGCKIFMFIYSRVNFWQKIIYVYRSWLSMKIKRPKCLCLNFYGCPAHKNILTTNIFKLWHVNTARTDLLNQQNLFVPVTNLIWQKIILSLGKNTCWVQAICKISKQTL